MKKTLFLLFVIFIVFASCEENQDDFNINNIIGTWECTRIEVNDIYDAGISTINASFYSNFTFNEDGTGTEFILFNFSNSITWTLIDRILTINTESETYSNYLSELSNTKYVYNFINDSGDKMNITYTRKYQ